MWLIRKLGGYTEQCTVKMLNPKYITVESTCEVKCPECCTEDDKKYILEKYKKELAFEIMDHIFTEDKDNCLKYITYNHHHGPNYSEKTQILRCQMIVGKIKE